MPGEREVVAAHEIDGCPPQHLQPKAGARAFPASPFFQVQTAFAHFEGVVDFVKKAYYVEATLIAPALVVGHPAAISIIKMIAEQTPFQNKCRFVWRLRSYPRPIRVASAGGPCVGHGRQPGKTARRRRRVLLWRSAQVWALAAEAAASFFASETG